jgi:hypothetical protein
LLSVTQKCGQSLLQLIEGAVQEKEFVHIQPVGGGIEFVTDYHNPSNHGQGLPQLWQVF